jgi:hypothetical protein
MISTNHSPKGANMTYGSDDDIRPISEFSLVREIAKSVLLAAVLIAAVWFTANLALDWLSEPFLINK